MYKTSQISEPPPKPALLQKIINYLIDEYDYIGKKEDQSWESKKYRNYYFGGNDSDRYPPIPGNTLAREAGNGKSAWDGHYYTIPIKKLEFLINIVNHINDPNNIEIIQINPVVMKINNVLEKDYTDYFNYLLEYGEIDILVNEQQRINNEHRFEMELGEADMINITPPLTSAYEIPVINKEKKKILRLIFQTMEKIKLLKFVNDTEIIKEIKKGDRSFVNNLFIDEKREKYYRELGLNEVPTKIREIKKEFPNIIRENVRIINELYRYILNQIEENKIKMIKPEYGVVNWLQDEIKRKEIERKNNRTPSAIAYGSPQNQFMVPENPIPSQIYEEKLKLPSQIPEPAPPGYFGSAINYLKDVNWKEHATGAANGLYTVGNTAIGIGKNVGNAVINKIGSRYYPPAIVETNNQDKFGGKNKKKTRNKSRKSRKTRKSRKSRKSRKTRKSRK